MGAILTRKCTCNSYRNYAFILAFIVIISISISEVKAVSPFQILPENFEEDNIVSSSTNCQPSQRTSVPITNSDWGGDEMTDKTEELLPAHSNPFGFASISACSRNGYWCSCNLPCSTADCCSGVCSGYTCVDYQCDDYPDYPNYCDGSCYSCSSISDYFSCDPWDGAVCCPSSYPYYCHLSGSCWSTEYLPNPCGSGCPPGETECNGDCWTCSSGTLCCPSSGDPYECCGSGIDCQSDGNCCNEDNDWCPNAGTSTSDCCEGTCANDNICGYPECFSDSNCPSDSWIGTPYCSGGDVWRTWRNHYCYNDGDHDADCRYSDNAQLYEDCGSYGCSSGTCNTCKPDGQTCSTPGSSTAECCSGVCAWDGICGVPECDNDGDCPADQWVGDPYCSGGNVWRGLYDNYCVNDGDHDAQCTGQSTTVMIENCDGYGCTNGVCNSCKPDGYSCSTPGSSTAECCSGICAWDGICGVPECDNDADCPPTEWIGTPYCQDGDVWQGAHDYYCVSGGDHDASCQGQSIYLLKEDCGEFGCTDGVCNTCKPDGYSCDIPGSSDMTCCSGTCQIDGTCGSDSCTDECPIEGLFSCADVDTQQFCGYYDTDMCLEQGGFVTCTYGCVSGECFDCPLSHCMSHSDDCCTRQEVCVADSQCNLNCEYGDYPDPDCCTDECNLFEQQCYDYTSIQDCGNFDADVCYEWGSPYTCAEGGCGGDSCFTCDLPYCTSHSHGCCQQSGLCIADGTCNLNCAYGDYPDPDCCDEIGIACDNPGGADANCCSGYCGDTSVCAVNPCNNNNVCEIGETPETCPGDCYCNHNYVCDANEDEISCPNDCGCDFDGTCDFNRGEDEANCPSDCSALCDMPDGSSYDCDCDSDTDCTPWGDYFCNQVSGPDACELVVASDECSNYNDYFCEDGWVKQCMLSGSHYVKLPIEDCNNKFEYCDPSIVNGIGACSEHPQHMDMWIDHADTGVRVNKKKGDILKVNIYSDNTDTVTLSYDGTKFVGDCPQGSYVVSSGINTCELTVLDTAVLGATTISADDKEARVRLIYDADLVIATDSVQLNERYRHEERAVRTMLKEAYAAAESGGLVYDLSWYDLGVTNPFTTFNTYYEEISRPFMMDNTYALEAAQFLKNKCDECSNLMILGDDFILPHYRRAIPTLTTYFLWFTEEGISKIYTDIAYTKKHGLQWYEYYEMFKIDGSYQGKDVMIILPDTVTTEMRTQIDALRQVLIDKNYLPQFEEMDGSSTFCVDESWGSDVKGKTLIIIGNEDTNNAFLCMPFVSGDLNEDVAFLQPNVWDDEEYAMVFNTMNESVIEVVVMLMESGEIANLRSHEAYVFHVGAQYAGYAAMIVGGALLIAGTGGTAAPAVLLAVGVIADAAADGADLVDTCVVNYESAGWCAASAGFAVLPYVPSKPMKQLIKSLGDLDFIAHFGTKASFVDQQISALTRSKAFDANDLKRSLKSVTESSKADELLQIAEGRQIVGGVMNILDAQTAAKKFKSLYPDTPAGREKALLAMKRNGIFKDAFDSGVEGIEWVRNTRLEKGVMRGVPSASANVDDILKRNGFTAIMGGTRNLEEHVIGLVDSSFVSTSHLKEVAVDFAKKEGTDGFVFFINPRSSPGIDVPRTFKEMPDPHEGAFAVAMDEAEIAVPDFIPKEDIIGFRKVNVDGEWVDDFIPNTDTYLGDIDKDMTKLFGTQIFD